MRLPQNGGGRTSPRMRGWFIVAALLLLAGGIGIGVGLWLPHPHTTPHTASVLAPPSPAPVPAPAPPSAPVAVAPAPLPATPAPTVPPTPPGPLALAPVPPPVIAPPAYPIRTATEAEILADQPEQLTIFRLTANPHVLVLDFPSLRQQGMMLNRIAALVEKAGQPRNRDLTDTELDAAIRASGETVESYYYGHDYSAADLARFFALADRDHVLLTREEEQLRGLLRQEGWLSAGAIGALISIPRAGVDKFVDAAVRSTILHHELSHGEYFTDPAYAAFTRRFWETVMSEDDRSRFRTFLGHEGYDTGEEDLMMNEMQAYLMHTPDQRFFNARAVGMPEQRLDRLKAAFLADMPRGWLRDETPAPPPVVPAAATPVRAQRRRRQRRGPVTSTRASAARCALRRCAASMAVCNARR